MSAIFLYDLCLHTPRADCNALHSISVNTPELCLHTLRADCNRSISSMRQPPSTLPPHAPCRLQRAPYAECLSTGYFASTRSVQIATYDTSTAKKLHELCLHTLRADCNTAAGNPLQLYHTLPPHAPCRLQPHMRYTCLKKDSLPPHAPCRLQRVLRAAGSTEAFLCLHTLRADCNSTTSSPSKSMRLCLHTLRADCNNWTAYNGIG